MLPLDIRMVPDESSSKGSVYERSAPFATAWRQITLNLNDWTTHFYDPSRGPSHLHCKSRLVIFDACGSRRLRQERRGGVPCNSIFKYEIIFLWCEMILEICAKCVRRIRPGCDFCCASRYSAALLTCKVDFNPFTTSMRYEQHARREWASLITRFCANSIEIISTREKMLGGKFDFARGSCYTSVTSVRCSTILLHVNKEKVL